MTGIVVLIVMGLLVYGIWQTVGKSAPDQGRKCSVCGTTKRTLQWMRSWEDCIHAILNTLIGERPRLPTR
jgi:hypothetical protein